MGAIWELFQEYQIGKRSQQTGNAEDRIAALEAELQFVEELLAQIIPLVEDSSGTSVEA